MSITLFQRPLALWLVALGLAGALSPVGPGSTRETLAAAASPVGATVSVLALPVEVSPAELGVFMAAVDKQTLGKGDIVRTGPGGIALLTFFDGSESQLGAESEVQIEQIDANPAPQIALFQASGVTVNHIVPMPPGGSFRTDTSAATGLVRGTSYIVIVAPRSADDQALDPTTRSSSIVLLTDRNGHVGRVDVAANGSTALPVQLAHAGDAATSAARNTIAAALDTSSLAQLEGVAHIRDDETASHATEQQARAIGAALEQQGPPRAARADDKDEREDGSKDSVPTGAPTRTTEPAATPTTRGADQPTLAVVTENHDTERKSDSAAKLDSAAKSDSAQKSDDGKKSGTTGQALPVAPVTSTTPPPAPPPPAPHVDPPPAPHVDPPPAPHVDPPPAPHVDPPAAPRPSTAVVSIPSGKPTDTKKP